MGWPTREIAQAYYKAWWAKNGKEYAARNREKLREADRKWKANPENKVKMNAGQKVRSNRRYRSDPNFRMMRKLRPRIRKLLRHCGGVKSKTTFALIGCTPEFLRGYFEGQMQPGWTWENTHIDHHIPCAAFDLTDPKQQEQCFHWSNLKLMLAIDNLRKGSKIPLT